MSSRWLARLGLGCALCLLLTSCAGKVGGGEYEDDGGELDNSADSGTGDARTSSGAGKPDSATSDGSTDGGRARGADGGPSLGAPGTVCAAPIGLVDTSHPTTVVGTGAGTCTEQQLEAALKKGGVITFDCGDDATIAISSEKNFVVGMDTTLDGNGKVTLDGKGMTRILSFSGPDFQKTTTKVTLQRMRLINGKAQSSMMFPTASAPCSQGAQDGSGGALLVRDADLRILDSKFENNQSALLGPDVGGGAVYAVGSIATTVIGSTFTGNKGSNGGAIGALFGNLTVYNSVFSDNQATGNGANSVVQTASCSSKQGDIQIGSGGNGGAIVMDGGEKFSVVVCGSVFQRNVAGQGALGGAIFRTPDVDVEKTTIDRCTFDANESSTGGALYFHHSELSIDSSTFHANIGHEGAGSIQVDDTVLSVVNSTFVDNRALRDQGGGGPRGSAITHYGGGNSSGSVQNSSFVGNSAKTGDGSAATVVGASMFKFDDSLFANNDTACDGSGTGANNLQWPSGATPCVQGIITADPQLGALQDNGGPTLTVLPATGSPAAKMGKSCPDKDQRGYRRSASCSIGAVEVGATAP